jgi:HK97 family phage major capsid protein
MRSILDKAGTEKRSLTQDEAGKYTELENKFSNITTEIEREVRFQAMEKTLAQVTEKREIAGGNRDVDAEVRSAFIEYAKTGDATNLRALSSYSAAEGGATVPTALWNIITTKLASDVVVRQLPGVDIMTVSSNVDFPIEATAPTADWVQQYPSGSGYGEGDPVFATVSAKPWKCARMVKVSEEILDDNTVNIENYLGNAYANAISVVEEAAFLLGNGSSKPTGLFVASGIGSSTATGSITGSQVTDALIDAKFTLGANYRRSACWVLSDAVVKIAMKAKDMDGQYLYQPSLQAGQPATLLGLPLYVSSQLPTTLSAGTHGGLVTPQYVSVVDRRPFRMQKLVERFAELGQVGFLFSKRVDCVLRNPSAVVKLVIN